MINNIVNSKNEGNTSTFSWGEVSWLVDKKMPEAEHAFGVSKIKPGKSNPLHVHPNCEEIMYIISGECECRLGEEIIRLTAGSVIRIPAGIKHNAKCISEDPVHAVISFPTVDRQTIAMEESDELA